MDLHEFRCLVATAEAGTFTRAASALHMTQPSLSYVIARLEAEVGGQVFERLPRGVRLTALGEALLEPARLALHYEERARAMASAMTGLVAGRLSLAVIRVATAEIAGFVAAFHERHPSVLITVDDPRGDAEVIEAVRSGRCELGICRTLPAGVDLDSSPLGWYEVVVIFPEGRAPRSRKLSVERLNEMPLILPVAGTAERHIMDEGLAAFGVIPIIAAECAHQEAAIELVRAGIGACIRPRRVAELAAATGLPFRQFQERVGTDLVLAYRRAAPSPAAAAFRATVADLIAADL